MHRNKTMKKAVCHGPSWAARRGTRSLSLQKKVIMTTSSGSASPSVLHTLPRVTHLVLFWLARTLGLVLAHIEKGTVAIHREADKDNVFVTIIVSGIYV